MPAPAVSFVVPVRNDAERLARCLASIRAAAPAGVDVEIVVADNGSTDGSAEVARRAGATVLSLPGLRVAELRNRAAAIARGDLLGFVDADHEIVPGWIAAAIELLLPAARGGAGAPCRPPARATWVQRLYDRLRRHPRATAEPVEWLGSGNMAVRRRAFEEVGGFDATLETCEDVDLCRKLRARGYGLVSDPRLGNVHYGDPATLRQVFYGEVWRGRDNVRVSLRAPRTVRTLASAAIPVLGLIAILTAAAGLLLLGPTAGWRLAGLSLTIPLVLVALRATVMLRTIWSADWPKALAVAAAYEAGRAIAVVGRVSYRRRRRSAAAA
ncbi:MAG: glycosyltransferase [Acidobacteria bacterium]|nr:glycosyltransferase [Acidobacteriota bacterium]